MQSQARTLRAQTSTCAGLSSPHFGFCWSRAACSSLSGSSSPYSDGGRCCSAAACSPTGSLAAFLCTAVFGLALPIVVGQRILVGLKKTTTQVATQAILAPFIFVCVGTVVLFAIPAGPYLAVFAFLASALVSVICLIIAARHISPQIGRAIREVPFRKKYPGVYTLGLAWPMLVQIFALPVAMQTDRLLLSHLTHGNELAEYNLASQLYGIVLQTIFAAGVVLWPIYAKARAKSTIESPMKPTLYFVAGGLAMGGALALVSPWIVEFISGGKITLDFWLVAGFVLFVTLEAAKYPVGMYMTDKQGLKFQVIPILILVPVNLALSWWLVGIVGAGGPIIGSAITVAAFQVLPNFWYVRRDLARRRAGIQTASEATPEEVAMEAARSVQPNRSGHSVTSR